MTEAAPALSTYQDEITFAKYDESTHNRIHLSPKGSSYQEYVDEVCRYYQVDELASKLKEQDFAKVTLQFPDELICDSATVVHELQKRVKCELWVLGDTSYSPCCIDEVAAGHVNSDLVVKFGNSCLNTINTLPCIYVLGRPQLDVAGIVSQFEEYKKESDAPIILMCDSEYAWKLNDIAELADVNIAQVCVDPKSRATILGEFEGVDGYRGLNRVIPGITSKEELSASNLVYIGHPQPPRMLQLTTSFNDVKFIDPRGNQAVVPNLNRRYLNMHKARSAATIGLLVNTLSLANTKELVKTLATNIRNSGKKHYMFVVGKPNVAKLANFESVDAWCVVGCDHQGIILDETGEYFKPIVTPYELTLALKEQLSWTGTWVTEFQSVYEDLIAAEQEHEEDSNSDYSDEEPEFDPVTGKFVATKPLKQQAYKQVEAAKEEETESSLVKKLSTTLTIKNTVSTSAAHLQQRQWTGLGSDWQDDEYDDEGAVVEEGRDGVARGYDFDRDNAASKSQ